MPSRRSKRAEELRRVVGYSAADEIEKLDRLKKAGSISDANLHACVRNWCNKAIDLGERSQATFWKISQRYGVSAVSRSDKVMPGLSGRVSLSEMIRRRSFSPSSSA